MSAAPKMIIPGPSLVQAAAPLQSPDRMVGLYSHQWLYPGPNSKHVRAAGQAATPAVYGTAATLVDYTVPQGLRFSLRGIVVNSNCSDWTEGSGDILFKLQVTTTGARSVEFFDAIATRLGGSTTGPFPVLGRLEFQSLDRLVLTYTPVANVTLEDGFGFGMLCGHTYPNNEAA